MSELLIAWVSLCVGVGVYALLTLPSWLFASMNRGTLWALRDAVVRARRKGLLPDVPQVEDFVERIDQIILVLPEVSALQLWWLQRRLLLVEQVNEDGFATIRQLESEADDAREFFVMAQHELGRIVLRHYLVGSWSGLVFVAPRHRDALRFVLSRRPGFYELTVRLTDVVKEPPGVHEQEREIFKRVERVAAYQRRSKDDLAAAVGF